MKPRWGKDFKAQSPQRSLDDLEKREMVETATGKGRLSNESVTRCLASDIGWRPSIARDWATEAIGFFLAYGDWIAFFLAGFFIGLGSSMWITGR